MLFAPEFPTAPTRRRPLRGGLVGAGLLLTTALGGGLGLAATAGATETVWDRVAVCESGGSWSINTGNGYYGGLQFSPATWKGFGGLTWAARADLATKDQQIYTAQRVLKVQGPGAWPTCSVKAGLTVTNGLAVVVNPGVAPTPTPTTTPTTPTPTAPTPAPTSPTPAPTSPTPTPTSPTPTPKTPTPTPTNATPTPTATSATPTPTPTTPISVNYSRVLVVDGTLGQLTKGAAEKWFGGTLNGMWSVDDVKKLQTKVGASPDGSIGALTTKALQRKVGVTADGSWGRQTTIYFQRFLNKTVYGQ